MIRTNRLLLTHTLTRPALRPKVGGLFRMQRVKAVVVHWTANQKAGANAEANRSYFNQGFRPASAHYIVDSDKVLLCIPEDEVAFHCGDKPQGRYKPAGVAMIEGKRTPNYYTIGVEMCVNADGDWLTTYEKTVQLCAQLMVKYTLPLSQLLRHFDVTGKMCPLPFIDQVQWAKFKDRVGQAMMQVPAVSWHRIIADALNVRSGPGVSNPIRYELFQGQSVAVFGPLQNGWAQIGEEEFVNAKYLSAIKP